MTSMIVFEQARVIDPDQPFDDQADVLVEAGRIVRVGRGAGTSVQGKGVQRINLQGKWLTPGFVDLHVHFREPGHEYKEDIETGLRAAAAGGFTNVCAMPNTQPVNDTRSITETILARGREIGGTRLNAFAAITLGLKGQKLTEMADLQQAGAIGVSDDGRCVMNAEVMRRAMQYAGTFDLLVSQHAEDHHLTEGAQMHEGETAAKLGLKGWPRVAEDIIVARDLLLAQDTRARYHVAHISSMNAVQLLAEAKSRGLRVSAEVTPHHLMFTDASVGCYDTACKVNPPLRSEEDRLALVEALADGTIDCIATDHAPHSSLEKHCEFSAASPGMIGLEVAMASLLELVRAEHLTATRLIEALTSAPCKIGRLQGGTLREGSAADITIIDPQLRWKVVPGALRSRSQNTPWLDQELTGAVVATFVNGRVAYSRNSAYTPG